MAQLTAERDSRQRGNYPVLHYHEVYLKAGAQVFKGGIVQGEAGLGVAGKTGLNLYPLGIARKSAVNTGANGAVRVEVNRGAFYVDNATAAADVITAADRYKECYVIDDHTVGKTDGGGTRSVAGRILDVEGSEVLVEIGLSLV